MRRLSLGIDVGGSSIKWAAVDGVVVDSGAVETPRAGRDDVLAAIARLVDDRGGAVGRVGVAFPGTVQRDAGRAGFLPNLPGEWRGYPVAEWLHDRCDKPIALINDARAFAWAELGSGAAIGLRRALFLAIGTGIGGAIALDHRLVIGEPDAVGELGHVPVDPSGERCGCGGRGCLETLASASAIAARVSRTMTVGQSATILRLTDHGRLPVTATRVAEAARTGDPFAMEAFERAANAIGMVVGAICLVLQLEAVVLGGGLTRAADLLLPGVQRALDERRSLTGPVEARIATHGSHAGAIGAALYAADGADSGRPT